MRWAKITFGRLEPNTAATSQFSLKAFSHAMEPRPMLIIFVLCYLSGSIYAQAGTDCVTDPDCYPHQTCQFGYCQCDLGYIKNIHHCFKIRGYGQECHFLDQCQDFRMLCAATHNEIKRCICDSYHQWDEGLQQCMQAHNFSDMVKELQEETKWSEDIAREGRRIFFGLVVAGLSVISIGLVCTALCLVYGCCCRGKRPAPSDDTEKLKIQEVASMGSPEGTYVPIPTDITGHGQSSSTSGVPIA